MNLPNKVVIATPFLAVNAFAPYIESMFTTVKECGKMGIDVQFYSLCGGAYLDRIRNTLTEAFLAHPEHGDTIVFVDYDMDWKLDDFLAILNPEFDVLSGCYVTREEKPRWTFSIPSEEGLSENRFIKATVVPAGFLKIKRKVFEAVGSKCWDFLAKSVDETKPSEAKTWGEDVSFTKRCLAAGIQPYLDRAVTLGHWGSYVWRGNFD